MDIKSLQMMIQNQAMYTMMADQEQLPVQSPLLDITFRQLLQERMTQATMLNQAFAPQTNQIYQPTVAAYRTGVSTTVPVTQFNEMISEVSQKYGIDEQLIHSIIKHESNYNSHARSSAGAEGLMQLMPQTAKGLGVIDSYNPRQNIEGGTKYLSQMLKRYNGDLKLALAAYNAGPGNVDKYNGIPPFTETQNYVNKVMNSYLA